MDIRAVPIEIILLTGAILLFLSILAGKLSTRLGIPALLIFLLIGMLAGSDGLGGIYFDDPWLAQFIGSVTLAFILFSGGLDTRWDHVKPVLGPSLLLSTIGVLITGMAMGYFAHLILKISLLEGMLLGAIVSSTDAAAVFSILRATGIRLKGTLESLLEVESGSNDPMAVFLTIGFTHLILAPETPVITLVGDFFLEMGIGALSGLILGNGLVWLINRINLKSDGLYPVLSFAAVLFIFSLTMAIGGSGFLAVYIAGMVLGTRRFLHKRSLTRVHDSLVWLLQIVMFLVLGLLVFPSQLVTVIGPGLILAVLLIVVARPLSVFVALLFVKMTVREKALVSWVGLRGAVPIILATFPLLAGIPNANYLFNVVFFVVITSVLIQGTSIPLVARWLKVQDLSPMGKTPALGAELADKYDGKLFEVKVQKGTSTAGQKIMDIGLPEDALVVLVQRGDEFIIPRGGLTLEEGDKVLVLVEPGSLEQTRALFDVNGAGSDKGE